MTRAHYGRLLTEAYDLDKPEAPPAMAAFYLSQVRAQSVDGPVLEAMCGSGRFLVPLLEAGIEVDGVDSSPDMLRAALWRLRQRGLRASLVEQWLHALNLGRQYAFALCVAGSFGLVIGDDEVAASLRRLREHLLPGGALLVETEAPRESRRRDGLWRGRTWPTHDGALLVERAITTYDAATQVETGVNIYERWVEGALLATELNDWACRFWAPEAFEAQLRAAGFENVEVAGRCRGRHRVPCACVGTNRVTSRAGAAFPNARRRRARRGSGGYGCCRLRSSLPIQPCTAARCGPGRARPRRPRRPSGARGS